MSRRKSPLATWLVDLLYFAVGSVLYGMSVNMFTAPNQIAPGGLTGLSTLINHVFGTPIGTVIFIMNLPLFAWAFLAIGYKLVMKTVVATFMVSAAIDLMSFIVTPYYGNQMLAAIFGGVVEGFSLSSFFMRGGTTGGTDLLARLLNNHLRHISMAKLMMCVDVVIVALAGFVYQSLESAMYALIVIFVSTRLIDTILYGTDVGTGKMLYVISEKNKEIARIIMEELDRGVTFLKSRGAYSGREGEIILCAVRRDEVVKVNDIVRGVDPSAFVIVGEAGEISGEGFREYHQNDKPLTELLQRKKRQGETK